LPVTDVLFINDRLIYTSVTEILHHDHSIVLLADEVLVFN
jgi:hypothetical protein